MTWRLTHFVSVSLLAHLALLGAWYVSPSTALLTPNAMQVELVSASQQTSSTTASQLPLPAKVPAQQRMTTPRPPTQAHRTQQKHSATKAAPAPAKATPAATTTLATAAPVIQKSGPKPSAATLERARSQVRRAFARYFNYPALARRRGWEGVVKLSLRLDPDGQLRAVRLIQSSGHPALDSAALASAQRIPPLREAVIGLQGNAHEIQLPVEYRLVDG